MSWLEPLKGLFGHKEKETPAAPLAGASGRAASLEEAAKKLEGLPEATGLLPLFYRKWKDPAFVKQMRALAAHMAKDGVNVKSMGEVKAWIEKNKEAIEAGRYNEPPVSRDAKPETYVKTEPDVGRNDPCPCGSGKKYKKCCGAGKER